MPLGRSIEAESRGIPALWASSTPQGDSDAAVRFFTPVEGSIYLKARGLLKPASKLAPLLQSGDELLLSAASARGAIEHEAAQGEERPGQRPAVLTGVALHRGHPNWRRGLREISLAWWMVECCCTASGGPIQNHELFQLTVNLLRSEPDAAQLAACAGAFAIKLLMILGLRPDFMHCSEDGHVLAADEPSFLLPSGEGLVGRAAYNEKYARSAARLPRIDAVRRGRWRALEQGPLLDYGKVAADALDVALLLHIATQHLADLANRPLDSAAFMRRQWKLQSYGELAKMEL
jgi:recombinational DNA repair protein (RecF pathway)